MPKVDTGCIQSTRPFTTAEVSCVIMCATITVFCCITTQISEPIFTFEIIVAPSHWLKLHHQPTPGGFPSWDHHCLMYSPPPPPYSSHSGQLCMHMYVLVGLCQWYASTLLDPATTVNLPIPYMYIPVYSLCNEDTNSCPITYILSYVLTLN